MVAVSTWHRTTNCHAFTVSYSYAAHMLRTLQTSRWNSGLKCRQPLRGHGRIKLHIRMSLDSIWEALAAPSIWDSCPRFLELLSAADLRSRQAKLQSDCHEDVAPSAKQAGRSRQEALLIGSTQDINIEATRDEQCFGGGVSNNSRPRLPFEPMSASRCYLAML